MNHPFCDLVHRARHLTGLDAATTYTVLARAVSIAGSTGTVLLIVRFLDPVEQGFYYTLLSLVSSQAIFELGFSFVIQQLSAHEAASLSFGRDGAVHGDAKAHSRLASTIQLSVRWYTRAAAALMLILAPLGILFFARQPQSGLVEWKMPWLTAVIASALGLWMMPLYSFLDGCGEIRSIAAMRLRQAAAAAVFSWLCLLSHHGLYSPALVIIGQLVVGLDFLARRRRLLFGLLRRPAGESAICWSTDVWPFQWRIAVSWMCSYCALQALVPIVFALRGAREAGQMGMSLSIVTYMTILALAWTSTKATLFGRMIARRQFREAENLLLRTVARSLAAFAAMSIIAVIGVSKLPALDSRLADRMVPAGLFALLVLAAAANLIVQSLAIYLRAFKKEPFLRQSLIVAALTLVMAAAAAPALGTSGAAASYFAATGVAGLPMALRIFSRERRSYRSAEQSP